MNFVVLTHEVPEKGRHFDFMLDNGQVLKTWSLFELPNSKESNLANLGISTEPDLLTDLNSLPDRILESYKRDFFFKRFGQRASLLPDHRRVYLDYEGEISRHRGFVQQWDKGDYFWLKQTATEIIVRVQGNKLNGIVGLIDRNEGDWLFFYCRLLFESTIEFTSK